MRIDTRPIVPQRIDRARVRRITPFIARWPWPYVPPLVVIASEWTLFSPTPALADHFQFWAAGRLASSGVSPYDQASWSAMAAYGPTVGGVAANTVIPGLALSDHFWLYPPQTAFVFAPFGVLPVALGVPLLHLFVAVTTTASVVLAARAIGLSGIRLAFALTLAAISEPFVIGIRDGHAIGLVLSGLVLVFVGLRDRRAWPLALGVALASVKPQLGLAFALAAIAYMARAYRPGLAIASIALAAVTIPADARYPFPVEALVDLGGRRSTFDLSTTGALARDLGDGAALTVAIASAAIVTAVAAVRASSADRRAAVAFGALLALSLAVTPYVQHYDQLLALPAAFGLISLGQGSRYEIAVSGLVAVLVGVVPWVLFYWWPLQGQGDRVYLGGALGALPVLVLIALALVAWRTSRPTRAW